eukprot:482898-Pelagomonas_calceolata.AAC.4
MHGLCTADWPTGWREYNRLANSMVCVRQIGQQDGVCTTNWPTAWCVYNRLANRMVYVQQTGQPLMCISVCGTTGITRTRPKECSLNSELRLLPSGLFIK